MDILKIDEQFQIHFQGENDKEFSVDVKKFEAVMDNAPLNKAMAVVSGLADVEFKIVEKEGMMFKVSKEINGKRVQLFNFNVLSMLPFMTYVTDMYVEFDKESIEMKRITAELANYIIDFMYKMINPSEKIMVGKKQTTTTVAKKKKSKGKNKSSIVKVTKKIYTVEYQGDYDKREYNRKVESWTQRGYWRVYKNGKKVWIKPMVKGNRNKPVSNKTYKL